MQRKVEGATQAAKEAVEECILKAENFEDTLKNHEEDKKEWHMLEKRY